MRARSLIATGIEVCLIVGVVSAFENTAVPSKVRHTACPNRNTEGQTTAISRRYPTPPPHLRFDEKRELLPQSQTQSVPALGADQCQDDGQNPYAVPSGVGGGGGEGGGCTFGAWSCDGLSLRLCGYVTISEVGKQYAESSVNG